MIFLMRHGEDDDSRLGGWSDASLCQNGIEQVKKSCERLIDNKYNIVHKFYTGNITEQGSVMSSGSSNKLSNRNNLLKKKKSKEMNGNLNANRINSNSSIYTKTTNISSKYPNWEKIYPKFLFRNQLIYCFFELNIIFFTYKSWFHFYFNIGLYPFFVNNASIR